MRKYILGLVLGICFTACQTDYSRTKENSGFYATEEMVGSYEMEEMVGSYEMEEDFQVDEPPRTAEPPAPPPISEENEAAEQIRNTIKKGSKIIKDGNVRVDVKNLTTAKAQMDSTLKQFDGYYENEGYQSGNYQSTYQLRIRVPTENFEQLINAVEMGGGKILHKNISARDVTEEYVDVAIRLNNNKNYLNRYQELLKKANSIKDILEIQEQSRQIEEEIDARTGRLKYIDDQVRFSTLRLELIQEHEYTAARKARNFGQQLVDSFKNGFDGFLDFTLVLVSIWPFILILGLPWWFRVRIPWRFWKKNS